MEWNDEVRGWVFTTGDSPVRTLTPRARYFLEQAAGAVDGQPWARWDCPWCGEPLPDLAPFRREE
jgi:hypothetical protein